MTLEGIINIINENLKEERKKVNINGKGIFKVEEHLYQSDEDTVNILIQITFNGYNVITCRHILPESTLEDNKEKVRYTALKYFFDLLKYGQGDCSYKLFLNDGFKGCNNTL